LTPFCIVWKPQYPDHQCLQVEIGYGADTDYSNNKAQRNVEVQSSPVFFQVKNTLTEQPAVIELVPKLANTNNPNWTFIVEPRQMILAAGDCPQLAKAELLPNALTPAGDRQRLDVAAIINTTSGPLVLGGVSVEAFQPTQTRRLPGPRTPWLGPRALDGGLESKLAGGVQSRPQWFGWSQH
jgi:hypothetical protein